MARTNPDQTKDLRELLDRAAELGTRLGLDKDAFLSAAWTAFLDARPGLREEIVERELGEQLATLRERGLIATA